MAAIGKMLKGLLRPRRVKYINVGSITYEGTWAQPPEDRGIDALAASISRDGLLCPLIVRKNGGAYELISGRRRLQAAKMCKLRRVPCLVLACDDSRLSAIRLDENMHRRPPDFIETALGLRDLVADQGMSIEEAAACTGLTAREATEKMRTLLLPPHVLSALRDSGLTERHALALLRISNPQTREAALCEMAYNDRGPEAAERYVDKLLRLRTPKEVPGQRPIYIVKDVRLFLNSVGHGIDMMRGSGIDAECVREEADNCLKLTIRIPQQIGG